MLVKSVILSDSKRISAIRGMVVNIKYDQYDVYIGRGSKWGNPFKIGIHGDREEVIIKYCRYLFDTGLINEIIELRGKRLGCYCKPKACHGDVLAYLANRK